MSSPKIEINKMEKSVVSGKIKNWSEAMAVILTGVLLSSCASFPFADFDSAKKVDDDFEGATLTEKDSPLANNEKLDPAEAEMLVSALEAEEGKSMKLSLSEAVLLALDNNVSFQIDRLDPAISKASEDTRRAAFDPTLSGSVSVSRSKDGNNYHDTTESAESDSRSLDGEIGVTQFLPTGTTVAASAERSRNTADATSATDSHANSLNYDVQVTQSLLRGFGTSVNLASLRQAKLDTRISQHELRAAAETLVSNIEEAYWNYVLAKKSIEIYETSLDVAEKEIAETKARIDVGKLAQTELLASEAEVAGRKEDLINARGSLATSRLSLLRLLGATGKAAWTRDLELSDDPKLAEIGLDDVESHVTLGLKKRADLKQALLELEKGEIEVVRTRNGLLPKLDLFVRLGNTSYAGSFSTSSDRDTNERDLSAGLDFEYTLGNRSERATYKSAQLSRDQLRSALTNMKQLVQVDIRSAYVEVGRAAEQMRATAATRKLRESLYETEQEKYKLDSSTSIAVAQAWRDLVTSRINEIEAVIDYRKALLELYRLEGTILERKGIAASFYTGN